MTSEPDVPLPSRTSHGYQRIIVASLVILYLLLACTWQGIRFADESHYLYAGFRFQPAMFLHQLSWVSLWSPLYALWIKGISLFVRDSVKCYFVSWGLLVVIVACIPLWMRMRAAWLYTLILVSIPFFSVWPYVSLFASAFFVAGMCLIWKRDFSVSAAIFLACVLSFVVSFARPEFQYGFFIAALGTLIALGLDKQRGAARVIFVKLLAVFLLAGTMLFVMKDLGGSRSGVAFAQHFNMRASEAGKLPVIAPFLSNYAQLTFNVDTQQPNPNLLQATIGDFYRANPHLFIHHLLRNARDPHTFVPVFVILALLVWVWRTPQDRRTRAAMTFVFFISLPVFASSILIYPREHYVQMLIPSLIILILQILSIAAPSSASTTSLIVAAGFALMLVGTAYRVFHKRDLVASARSNDKAIACMRELEKSSGVGNGILFDTLDVDNVYLNTPRTLVTNGDLHDWPTVMAWAEKTHPGWIVTDPDTALAYGVSPTEISNFVEAEMHYTPHACPQTRDVTVYISKTSDASQ